MKYTEVLSPSQQPIVESFLRDFARFGGMAIDRGIKLNVGDFLNEYSQHFKHSKDFREELKQSKQRSKAKLGVNQ